MLCGQVKRLSRGADERRTPCDVAGCGDPRLSLESRRILNTRVARSRFRDRGWGRGTKEPLIRVRGKSAPRRLLLRQVCVVEGSERQGGLAFAVFVSWPCRGAFDARVACCTVPVRCGGAYWLLLSWLLPPLLLPSLFVSSSFSRFAPGLRQSFARRWGKGGGGRGGRGGDGG